MKNKKIVLGLGNSIDYEIVWDTLILEQLITQYKIRAIELDTNKKISCERDLVVSILSYFKDGIGGECFVTSSSIIQLFAHHFAYSVTLGGTAVRAAHAMHKIGYTSTLHLVSLNDIVRLHLPSDIHYISSAQSERIFPHLVIQYESGAQIKVDDIYITTSNSNRLIYVNDSDNAEMYISDRLGNELETASIFLISGFNAMRNESMLKQRLQDLKRHIAYLPKDALVFFEDACYHNPHMSKIVFSSLKNHLDIISMNEDEMQEYLGREIDLLNELEITDALVKLKTILGIKALVIHTRYWALVYGDNAIRYQGALQGGIVMAGTRFRYGDSYGVTEFADTSVLPDTQSGVDFSENLSNILGEKVCCKPSKALNVDSPTTIGLGDSFVGGFLAFVKNL